MLGRQDLREMSRLLDKAKPALLVLDAMKLYAMAKDETRPLQQERLARAAGAMLVLGEYGEGNMAFVGKPTAATFAVILETLSKEGYQDGE